MGAISEWRVGLQCPDGQVSCMSVGAAARGRITTRSISFPISHLQCNFLWPRLDRSHFPTRSISFRDSTRGHGPRQSDRSEKSESSCMIHKFVSDQSGINTVQFHFTVAGAISENSTCPVLTICSPDLRPFSVIGTSLFSPARQCTELQ